MIVGPTGSGKSSAMGGIILGDISSGAGVGVMSPPDLIEDILERVPPERAGDVVLFEPARGGTTFGLDVFAGTDAFTAADHLLSIFHELYRDSWGNRMAAHLRNALQTLAVQPGATLIAQIRSSTAGAAFAIAITPIRDPLDPQGGRTTTTSSPTKHVRLFPRQPSDLQ